MCSSCDDSNTNINSNRNQYSKKPKRSYPFLTTPGPAVAILSQSNYKTGNIKKQIVIKDLKVNTNTNLDMNVKSDEDLKGIVAAAALEVSQKIPLPLKKVNQIPLTKTNETLDQDIDNKNKIQNDKLSESGADIQDKIKLMEGDEEEDFNLSDYVVGSNDNVVSCICGNKNLEEDSEEEDNEVAVVDDINSSINTENSYLKKKSINLDTESPHKIDDENLSEEEEDDEENSVTDIFWLQCDHCNRWVHGKCYGLKDDTTVDNINFHCHVCKPEAHPDAIKKFKKVLAKKQPRNIKRKKTEKLKTKQKDAKKVKETKKEMVDEKSHTFKTDETVIESETIVDDTIKRIRLKNVKDLYGNVYYPIDENEYTESYIKKFLFISTKRDLGKNWVVEASLTDFENSKVEIKTPSSKNGDKFTGISSTFVISKEHHLAGDLIHEIVGKIGDQKNYINDPKNQYKLIGVSKPKVIFHPKWPIYIDMRLVGNDIRFLRRSCHPNCEIVSAIDNQNGFSKFFLKSLKDISVNEELTISWQWDINHPMWKITPGKHQLGYDKESLKLKFAENPNNNGLVFNELIPFELDELFEPERYFLIYCVDIVLTLSDCACPNHKRCQLRTVKKYYTTLLKLKKSMSLSTMRYKTYDLLNQQKLKEPKQSSILNDLKAKEENRYVNRFNDYKSFLSRKRKLEEEAAQCTEQENLSAEIFEINTKKENSTSSSFLPSPLSPKQYKLELIAQYKLQNALQNNSNINYKKQKTLESTIPKLVTLFKNNTSKNTLIKSDKLNILNTILNVEKLKNSQIDNKNEEQKSEFNYQEILLQKLMKCQDIFKKKENKSEQECLTNTIDAEKNTSFLNTNDLNSNSSNTFDTTELSTKLQNTSNNGQNNNECKVTTSFNSNINPHTPTNATQTKKKMSFADYRKKSKPN
ncbi:hypothetical protein QEN19_003201 [Hanseniaspora menglaensis]